jgi:CRP-like cAMP-binding protein
MGELFGEMAIIYGSKRMAHAVAMEDSVIVCLPRAGLEAMLAKLAPMVKTLIQIMTEDFADYQDKGAGVVEVLGKALDKPDKKVG